MKRLLAVAPVLAAVAAGTVACGGSEPGNAQPGPTEPAGSSRAVDPAGSSAAPSASSGSSGGSGPLAGTDPCSLLPQQFLSQLGVEQGQPGQVDPGVSKACDFNGPSYGASVAVYYTVPYDKNLGQLTTPIMVNGGARKALQARSRGGLCSVSMRVTNSSSVEVIGTAQGDQRKACQLATLVAKAVEPQLPKS